MLTTAASTSSARFGESGPPCLLLHGFTGSPWDLFPLAVALEKHGFSGVVPCLPGHGQDGEAMATTDAEAWLRASETALFDEVKRSKSAVHLAGFSMGGLLAIGLAARWPEHVRSLALLAPAARLQGRGPAAARLLRKTPLLDWIQPYVPKDGSDLENAAVRAQAPRPSSFPSARLRDLFWLQDFAEAQAPHVHAPTLLVLARNDHVVDGDAARALAAKIPEGPLETLTLERGFHGLARDYAGEELASGVAEFFAGQSLS